MVSFPFSFPFSFCDGDLCPGRRRFLELRPPPPPPVAALAMAARVRLAAAATPEPEGATILKGREKKFDKSRCSAAGFRIKFSLVQILREDLYVLCVSHRNSSNNPEASNGLTRSCILADILNEINYFQRNYIGINYTNTYTNF